MGGTKFEFSSLMFLSLGYNSVMQFFVSLQSHQSN